MLALKREEALDAGLTRVARETAARAAAHLVDETADTATRVHEARRRLKELRAILRLGRYGLDVPFGPLNDAFGDVARGLAAIRDADAALAVVRSLRGKSHDPLERRALTRVARLLASEQSSDAAPPVPESWPDVAFVDAGTRWFERGLRRTYRDGRRAFREARTLRTAEAIHEWRKRVKDLWYEVRIVAPAWPEVLDARADLLHDLSRLLGEHHDIWSLRERVDRKFGKVTAKRIAAIAQRRLAEIEPQLFEKGAFAYAESPRAWSESLIRFWRAWTERL